MVKRGRTPNLPEKRENAVYFPVAESRQKFSRNVRSMLPGVRRADVTLVRGCQPYLWPKRLRHLHPLPALAHLAKLDKHRTIQPVWVLPDEITFEVGNLRDCIVTRFPSSAWRRELKIGAEVSRVYVRKTGPNPYGDMKGEISLKPAVTDRLWLDSWLDATRDLLGTLLAELGNPPTEIETLGIRPQQFAA